MKFSRIYSLIDGDGDNLWNVRNPFHLDAANCHCMYSPWTIEIVCKMKFSLCIIKHHAIKTWGMEVQLHIILTFTPPGNGLPAPFG
jgi:hypothetical protein